MALLAASAWGASSAHAGGPRYVAGSTYFAPQMQGRPVTWATGALTYFTDQGDLSGTVTNGAANAAVAAAAATWSAVPTAGISIVAGGSLAEDVNGSNVIAANSGITLPADIQSTALSTPIGIVYDADGAVIDALYGTGASDPDDCIDSGVMSVVDNLATSGSIAHAVILINGRCTGTAVQLEQIQFQLTRAFGRVLGLDWAQANDGVLFAPSPSSQQLEGWPVMRPLDRDCNQLSVQCVPNPLQLRADDSAAISRLYPVTSANLAQFAGKQLTAGNTLSIHGSVYFRRGQGMQGVNVIARPITPGVLEPDDRYPVASVTGFLFTGDRGNPVNGLPATGSANAPSSFGSDDPLVEGFYDLSGIPLPPGAAQADYQLTLEPVNALYTGAVSVGPYSLGQSSPSGTLHTLTLRSLTAGQSVEQDFTISDSEGDLQTAAGGAFLAPAALPPGGEWHGRVPTAGETSWFAIPVAAGRHFTIESAALEATGDAAEDKLRTVLGVWDGSDAEGSAAVTATVAPFNGAAAGVTALGVDTLGIGELLLAVADQRGDGRPDYGYQGRLLYAASVVPERLPLTGGVIRISGSGFRPGMTLSLGANIAATITEITPTLMVAIAPPSAAPSGSLDLVLQDPATNGSAVIAGGISYGSANGDALSIATALPASLDVAASAPFRVQVLGPDQTTPIAGVPVTFTVLAGTAGFAECAASTCSVATSGDGYATATLTAGSAGLIKLQASLTSGASLGAETTGILPLAILPLTGSLFLAPGATLDWTAQVQVVAAGEPVAATTIHWFGQAGLAGQSGSSATDAQGQAQFAFSLGPWAAGASPAITACIGATVSCTSFPVYVVHPEAENLVAVSGLAQAAAASAIPAPEPIVMRLIAPSGDPVVGGAVTFQAAIRSWTPSCPQGSCPRGRLLGMISQTVVTDRNGLAAWSLPLPVGLSGIPIRIRGLAGVGTSASLPFQIDFAGS